MRLATQGHRVYQLLLVPSSDSSKPSGFPTRGNNEDGGIVDPDARRGTTGELATATKIPPEALEALSNVCLAILRERHPGVTFVIVRKPQ